MNSRLPAWSQRLLARHPGAPAPQPHEPLPEWLAGELRQTPLWAFIRGVDAVRAAHPYFLHEDVHSQPQLLERALALRGELAALADRLVAEKIDRVVFTGCGSAFFTSLFAAQLWQEWTGLDAAAIESLELVNYGLGGARGARIAVIAQSATGGSIETLQAVRRARTEHAVTVALTNTPGSALAEQCEHAVALATPQKCGPDVSVITTRLVMLYLLAERWGVRSGSLDAAAADKCRGRIEAIPADVDAFLEHEEAHLADLARRHARQTTLMFVGGGPNWYGARECALKVEEESSLVCKAYRPAEYPHDAIALLSPHATTVALTAQGPSYVRTVDCLRTGHAAGSPTIALAGPSDAAIAVAAQDVVRTPDDLPEIFLAPLATVFGQTLGYYLGLERGVNPDTLKTDDLAHAEAWLTSFPLGTH